MAHADAHGSGATMVEEGGDPGDSHKENDSKAAADADDVWEDSDAKLPAPLSNGAYRKILKELPDGPRIAAETCVKFWKEKKFPTEELVAFLKTISVHSPTLKQGFDDQHNGFLRAMKLQEEQQRKREEEEMSRRHQVPWMSNYPAQMLMEHGMYMGMVSDMTRFPAAISRTAAPYGLAHDMYPGGSNEIWGGARRHRYLGPGEQDGVMPPAPGLSAHGLVMDGHPPSASGMRTGWELGSAAWSGHKADGSMRRRRGRDELEEEAWGLEGRGDGQRRRTGGGGEGAGMHLRSTEVPVADEDLAAARTALMGKDARDLVSQELGDLLTEHVHKITPTVLVKVVADVRRRVLPTAGPERRGFESGGDGSGPGACCYHYRSKTVLAFRSLPGSLGHALTFGMIVHEYGNDAPPCYRGKVLLECIDGTPLFHGETSDERQRCLSAIAQGYMQFAAREGFMHLLIRVPPPTDSNAHLFSARAPDVQLKASQHLSQWYTRQMEQGVRAGILSDFLCSPDGTNTGFPMTILTDRDLKIEEAFAALCEELDASENAGAHRFSAIARADRYFVATLRAPEDAPAASDDQGLGNMGRHLPFILCPLAANRHRFTSFCAQRRLFFHSIEHAQYSTMILMREFLRQHQVAADRDPPDAVELDSEWDPQAAVVATLDGHWHGSQQPSGHAHHGQNFEDPPTTPHEGYPQQMHVKQDWGAQDGGTGRGT